MEVIDSEGDRKGKADHRGPEWSDATDVVRLNGPVQTGHQKAKGLPRVGKAL